MQQRFAKGGTGEARLGVHAYGKRARGAGARGCYSEPPLARHCFKRRSQLTALCRMNTRCPFGSVISRPRHSSSDDAVLPALPGDESLLDVLDTDEDRLYDWL